MATTGGGISLFSRMKRQQAEKSSSNESLIQNDGSFQSPSDNTASSFGNDVHRDNFSFRPSSRESEFGGFGDYDEAPNNLASNHHTEYHALSSPSDTPTQGIALFARRAAQQQASIAATNPSDVSQKKKHNSAVKSTIETVATQSSNLSSQRGDDISKTTNNGLITPNDAPEQGFAKFSKRAVDQSSASFSNSLASDSSKNSNQSKQGADILEERTRNLNVTTANHGIAMFARRPSQSSQSQESNIVSPTTRLSSSSAPKASPASFTPSNKPNEFGALVTPDTFFFPTQYNNDQRSVMSLQSKLSDQPHSQIQFDSAELAHSKTPRSSDQTTLANVGNKRIHPPTAGDPNSGQTDRMKQVCAVNAKITPSRPLPSTSFVSTAGNPPTAPEAISTPTSRQSSWTGSDSAEPHLPLLASVVQAGHLGNTPVSGLAPSASMAKLTVPRPYSESASGSTVASNRSDNVAADERHDFLKKRSASLLKDDSIEALYSDFAIKCRDINERQNHVCARLLDMEVRYEMACYGIFQHQADLFDLLLSAECMESEMGGVLHDYENAHDAQ